MDLSQRKLTRKEWDGTELPVNDNEERILKMIIRGWTETNVCSARSQSLFDYLKIPRIDGIDEYIYSRYIESFVKSIAKKNDKMSTATYNLQSDTKKTKSNAPTYKPNTRDIIRLDRSSTNLDSVKSNIFEFVTLDILKKLIRYEAKDDTNKVALYWYTLNRLIQYRIPNFNTSVRHIIINNLERIESGISVRYILKNADKLMDRNELVEKYRDEELYDHQKSIYNIFKQSTNRQPKLVLYTAPTATGKTMTPLGLSESYKIIFVCAARHVGLALAKSAISVRKKIAFAFGASCAEDIRLHYHAATEFTRDRRSGGIRKVDNTVGDKVEIMICDLKSYIPAMLYMLAFNDASNIILFWDEPTISLDYDTHDCHDTIAKNWSENVIPNVVLSSATLPSEDMIRPVIDDFSNRFDNAIVQSIVSHDCRKTIPLITREGYVGMPHNLANTVEELHEIMDRCLVDTTTLRHLDLIECVEFIGLVHDHKSDYIGLRNEDTRNHRYHMNNWFDEPSTVDGNGIKRYYLTLLKLVDEITWPALNEKLSKNRRKRIQSNVHIVTSDAHTLTDGPTIYIAEDIERIGKFIISQSKIPSKLMDSLMENIVHNNKVNQKLAVVEKSLEDKLAAAEGGVSAGGEFNKSGGKNKTKQDNKLASDGRDDDVRKMMKTIKELEKLVRVIQLEDEFVPNTNMHIKKWANNIISKKNDSPALPFSCDISSDIVERIMLISEVSDIWKLLLLCGIGVFTEHTNIKYTEIMKHLADEKKLFMIIGSPDFIYGTNYQFSHGYIGADMEDMTQQKITQTLGRVGRMNVTSTYSVRFRSDELIKRFFTRDMNPIEKNNMNRLFIRTENEDTSPASEIELTN